MIDKKVQQKQKKELLRKIIVELTEEQLQIFSNLEYDITDYYGIDYGDEEDLVNVALNAIRLLLHTTNALTNHLAMIDESLEELKK